MHVPTGAQTELLLLTLHDGHRIALYCCGKYTCNELCSWLHGAMLFVLLSLFKTVEHVSFLLMSVSYLDGWPLMHSKASATAISSIS